MGGLCNGMWQALVPGAAIDALQEVVRSQVRSGAVCVSSTGSTGSLSVSSERIHPPHMCTYSLMCSLRHSS